MVSVGGIGITIHAPVRAGLAVAADVQRFGAEAVGTLAPVLEVRGRLAARVKLFEEAAVDAGRRTDPRESARNGWQQAQRFRPRARASEARAAV